MHLLMSMSRENMSTRNMYRTFVVVMRNPVFLLFLSACFLSLGIYNGFMKNRCSRVSRSSNDKMDNTFTIVTALYEINRAKWPTIKRSMDDYLGYFKHLLGLHNDIIVFTDQDSVAEYVFQQRSDRLEQTLLNKVPLKELEYYVCIDKIREILKSHSFRVNNSNLWHPESYSAEYLVLTWSKISLMLAAANENPFGSTHFIWLDAGYGHGEIQYPETWVPTSNIAADNKLTWIALENPMSFVTMKDKHKLRIKPVFNGGLFCGHLETLTEYDIEFKKTIFAMMNENIVDDEQGVALEIYFRNPYIFNIVRGSWYDGFKLFHKNYTV